MFGHCKVKRTCPFRHYILPMSDFDNSVLAKESVLENQRSDRKCGVVSVIEYDVVTVNSASHYYVRLRKSKDISGNIVRDFGQSYVRLGMKMAGVDEKELEEINPEELKASFRNEIFIIKEKDHFKRAKLLSEVTKMINPCPKSF